MAVDSSHLLSANRDAFWQATQAELRIIQRRGDAVSLVGLALVGALMWYSSETGGTSVIWGVGIAGIAMAFLAISQLLVARAKRRIAAERGMNCRHCGYVPHHTEISDVIATRECPHCKKPLD
jgi:hypothetical protein